MIGGGAFTAFADQLILRLPEGTGGPKDSAFRM